MGKSQEQIGEIWHIEVNDEIGGIELGITLW